MKIKDLYREHNIPTEDIAQDDLLEMECGELSGRDFELALGHLDDLFCNNPSSRINVVIVITVILMIGSSGDDSSEVTNVDSSIRSLARSPFFRRSLLSSLLFDQNPELFLLQIRLLTYVIPFTPMEIAAASPSPSSSDDTDTRPATDPVTKDTLLPKLLLVIARAVCWFAPLAQPTRRTRKAEGGGYFDRYAPPPRPGNARHRSSTGLVVGSEASSEVAIGGSNYRRRDQVVGGNGGGGGGGVGGEVSGGASSMERHTPPRDQSGDAGGLEGYMAFRKRQEEEEQARLQQQQQQQRSANSAAPPLASTSSYGELSSHSPETDLIQGDGITSTSSSGSFHLPPHPSQSWKTLTGTVQLDLQAYIYLSEALFPKDPRSGHSSIILDDLVTEFVRDVYGYWPGNLLAFIRDPVEYLTARGEACVFATSASAAEGWKSVFADRAELVARMTHAMRDLTVNPLLLQWTPREELANVSRFSKLDTAELVASSHRLLPRRDKGFGVSLLASDQPNEEVRPSISTSSDGSSSIGFTAAKDGGGGVGGGVSRSELRGSREGNSSPINILSRNMAAANISGPSASGDRMRREQVMLATELVHTKRLAKLYLSHVNRLHMADVNAESQEAQVQSAYNWLKEAKAAVNASQEKVRSLQQENAKMKERTNQWNEENRAKLRELREEKRNWTNEASKSRAALEEQNRILEMQRSELAKVKEANFKLKNQLTEAEPKIRHITDYETQISLLTDNQRLWDSDLRKMADMEKGLSRMMSGWKQMEFLIVHTNKERVKLAKELETCRQELDDARSDLAALRRTPASTSDAPEPRGQALQEEVTKLSSSLRSLGEQFKTLEEQKLEADAKIEAMQFELQSAAARDQPRSSLVL